MSDSNELNGKCSLSKKKQFYLLTIGSNRKQTLQRMFLHMRGKKTAKQGTFIVISFCVYPTASLAINCSNIYHYRVNNNSI